MMENLQTAFDATTAVIRDGLTWLDVRPESYRFLFPAGKDAETIRKLVADGYFPTIPHLAPAITYALVLSLVRFFMQLFILKVQRDWGLGWELSCIGPPVAPYPFSDHAFFASRRPGRAAACAAGDEAALPRSRGSEPRHREELPK